MITAQSRLGPSSGEDATCSDPFSPNMTPTAVLPAGDDSLLDETLPHRHGAQIDDTTPAMNIEDALDVGTASEEDLKAFDRLMHEAIDLDAASQPSVADPSTSSGPASALDDHDDSLPQAGPGPSAAKRRKMEAKRAKRAELRAMGILPSVIGSDGAATTNGNGEARQGHALLPTSLRLFASWRSPKPVLGLLGVKREEWVVP